MNTKCRWNMDRTLSSCNALRDHTDKTSSHKKGLSYLVVVNAETLKQTTYGVVYKNTAADRGLMLNYCPWCGADISPRGQEQC